MALKRKVKKVIRGRMDSKVQRANKVQKVTLGHKGNPARRAKRAPRAHRVRPVPKGRKAIRGNRALLAHKVTLALLVRMVNPVPKETPENRVSTWALPNQMTPTSWCGSIHPAILIQIPLPKILRNVFLL